METLLLRTKAVIHDCESHLSLSSAYGTEIESYLTQHALVVLCADIQQAIYKIAGERAAVAHDNDLANYVFSTSKKILRSVRKDEIADFLGMFGAHIKEKLNIILNEKDITIYNNAVRNRHDVAHNHGAQITFKELKLSTEAAERLLVAVHKSLEKHSPNINDTLLT